MSTKMKAETKTDSATSKTISLRVWIANEHGNEINHCHIDVPVEALTDTYIEDLDAVEEAQQELIDDYVESLVRGIDKPHHDHTREKKQ
jgi:hypothetical protein